MNREYRKWYSPALHREMELLVFGHAGLPLIVFPTSTGRFYDYEDRGMIRVMDWRYKSGALQAFTLDGVDAESWYNKQVHPRDRLRRHNQYEQYVINEVIPYLRSKEPLTGAGAHRLQLRRLSRDELRPAPSRPGDLRGQHGRAFDIRPFLDGYFDDNCYFNAPLEFLPHLNDDWYLSRYRTHTRLVLATGERDICLAENQRLSRIMTEKQIPHWLDVWGDRAGHDWPWWQRMTIKFFGQQM